MKLAVSPASDPRPGRADTVDRERDEIERLLTQSPSLRSAVPDIVEQELPRMRARVARQLARHGEQPRVDLGSLDFDEAAVLVAPVPPEPI